MYCNLYAFLRKFRSRVGHFLTSILNVIWSFPDAMNYFIKNLIIFSCVIRNNLNNIEVNINFFNVTNNILKVLCCQILAKRWSVEFIPLAKMSWKRTTFTWFLFNFTDRNYLWDLAAWNSSSCLNLWKSWYSIVIYFNNLIQLSWIQTHP